MNVQLIAFMQPNLAYLSKHNPWKTGGLGYEPEWMAAAAMRSTRTDQEFHEILNECDKGTTMERIQESVRRGHFTVAGMTDFMFLIEGISRACSHQLVRHRTAWYLQQSQRVVDPTDKEDWYVTPPEMETPERIDIYREDMEDVKGTYDRLVLFEDVSREDARFVLPNATKTRVIMKIDGSNLLHFLKLRLDPKAQWEIQELARLMLEEVQKVCPTLFDETLSEHWW